MTPPSKWTMQVHAHCLRLKCGVSPAEAAALFGPPPGSSQVSEILGSARRNGWFRREAGRYYAINRTAADTRTRVDPRVSFFSGIKRVNSVWQLGSLK